MKKTKSFSDRIIFNIQYERDYNVTLLATRNFPNEVTHPTLRAPLSRGDYTFLIENFLLNIFLLNLVADHGPQINGG